MPHSRDEIESMIDLYQRTSDQCSETGDWAPLGELYTPDALYTWNIGDEWMFAARGPQEITDWALGTEMAGLDGWHYPYVVKMVDAEQDFALGIWRQISEEVDEHGDHYEIAGTGGSWFHYAGDMKWDWQRDFFDHANAGHTFLQMAAAGKLSDTMQRRMSEHPSTKPGWIPRRSLDWYATIPGITDTKALD